MSKPFNMTSGKRSRRPLQWTETVLSAAEKRAIDDCASQLRQIGDKVDLKQKVLNAFVRIFRLGT